LEDTCFEIAAPIFGTSEIVTVFFSLTLFTNPFFNNEVTYFFGDSSFLDTSYIGASTVFDNSNLIGSLLLIVSIVLETSL
jgi:hypothetical protein